MTNWCAEDISNKQEEMRPAASFWAAEFNATPCFLSLSNFLFIFTFFIYIVFNPQGWYFTGFLYKAWGPWIL